MYLAGGGSKPLFPMWYFYCLFNTFSHCVTARMILLIRCTGFNWNLPFFLILSLFWSNGFAYMGTDALDFCVFTFPPLSIVPSVLVSPLQVLMVRLRVYSMQADMPVNSSGSTCSPFHNIHSFHTATALHKKKHTWEKHTCTQTRHRRCTEWVEVFFLLI